MEINERELEDMIWNAVQQGKIQDLKYRGISLPKNGLWIRQLDFGTGWGRCDLFCIKNLGEHCASITILELKKDEINSKTFMQACRYALAFNKLFSEHITIYSIQIILIGNSISKESDFCFLPDMLNFDNFSVKNYTYSIDFDGVKFKEHRGYHPHFNGSVIYPSMSDDAFNLIIDKIAE